MENEKPRISVVIPTFNRWTTLPRAIESVLNQSSQPEEIIVVDNGSLDETMRKVKIHYPSIKLLFEKKIGVSAARNLGIRASKGNWVAFLDSDDEWCQNKLERQILCQKLSLKGERLVHTNELWKKNNVLRTQMKKHKKAGGNIFFSCLPLCCISPSSTLIRKDVFQDIGYFDENLPACEDYDFWLRFCANEEVLFVDDNLIIKHGGHTDQLSKKYWAMDRFRIYALEKLIKTTVLPSEHYKATFEMLISKLDVLINGGRKHKNKSLLYFYTNKKNYWLGSYANSKENNQIKIRKTMEYCGYYYE